MIISVDLILKALLCLSALIILVICCCCLGNRTLTIDGNRMSYAQTRRRNFQKEGQEAFGSKRIFFDRVIKTSEIGNNAGYMPISTSDRISNSNTEQFANQLEQDEDYVEYDYERDHEQVIDIKGQSLRKPLLQQKFPHGDKNYIEMSEKRKSLIVYDMDADLAKPDKDQDMVEVELI